MDDKIESMKRKIKEERQGSIDPVPSLNEVRSGSMEKPGMDDQGDRLSPPLDQSENLKFLNDHAAIQNEDLLAGYRSGSLIKRLMVPLVRSVAHNFAARWNEFAARLVRFLNEAAGRFNRHEHGMRELHDRMEQNSGHLTERMDLLYGKSEGNLISMEMEIGRLQKEVRHCMEKLDAFRESHTARERQVKEILAELGRGAERKKRIPAKQADAYLERMVSHDNYHFESLFREKSEHLVEKFKAYRAFFENCSQVLDLGCGRGEFLKLMAEQDIQAYGVDSNAAMVEACGSKGLDARQEDLIRHLRSLERGRVEGMFAAQLVEHLSTETLREFVELAYDRLSPGGKLVVETINPESLYALSRTFYLDFTHIKPISPEGLKFLLEAAGFHRLETRFLSPVPEEVRLRKLSVQRVRDREELAFMNTYNKNIDRLNSLLYGYQEYAVLAQKGDGEPEA